MRNSLSISLFLLVFAMLSLLPVSTTQGQAEAEAATQLRLENQKRPMNSITVKEGKAITVLLKDNRTYKGHLAKVYEDGMRVDSIDFRFDEIQMVRLPGVGNAGAKVSGKVLLITGLIGFIVGGLMTAFGVYGLNGATDCSQIFGLVMLVLFGIAIGGTALVFLIVGLIAYLVGMSVGKAYQLGPKWRLRKAVPPTP